MTAKGRFSLDTNILVHAVDRGPIEPNRRLLSASAARISRAPAGGLPAVIAPAPVRRCARLGGYAGRDGRSGPGPCGTPLIRAHEAKRNRPSGQIASTNSSTESV